MLWLFAWMSVAFALDVSDVPNPRHGGSWISDSADLLGPEVTDRLTRHLDDMRHQFDVTAALVTVDDTPDTPRAFAAALFDHWDLADKGLLILMVPGQPRLTIVTGDGLKQDLDDYTLYEIQREDTIPRFEKGDLEGGVESGIIKIGERLAAHRALARALQARETEAQARRTRLLELPRLTPQTVPRPEVPGGLFDLAEVFATHPARARVYDEELQTLARDRDLAFYIVLGARLDRSPRDFAEALFDRWGLEDSVVVVLSLEEGTWALHAEDQVHPRLFEATWVDELFDHAQLTPAPLGKPQPLWLDTLIEPLARRWAMRKVPQVSSFEITHLHVRSRSRAWVHARFEPPLTRRELAYATDIMDPFVERGQDQNVWRIYILDDPTEAKIEVRMASSTRLYFDAVFLPERLEIEPYDGTYPLTQSEEPYLDMYVLATGPILLLIGHFIRLRDEETLVVLSGYILAAATIRAALLPAYVVVTVTWAHLAMLSALLLGPSAYRYSRRYGA